MKTGQSSSLEILFTQAYESIGEELGIDEHEVVPVGILCHLVNILADELERLFAQHRVIVELG